MLGVCRNCFASGAEQSRGMTAASVVCSGPLDCRTAKFYPSLILVYSFLGESIHWLGFSVACIVEIWKRENDFCSMMICSVLAVKYEYDAKLERSMTLAVL